MGLDTTHDCWHGAYSAFNRWRNTVAELAGYQLKNDGIYDFPDIDWTALKEGNLLGDWDELPEDPMVVLIAHSDCEGELPVPVLLPLVDRLEKLVPQLPEGDGGGHIWDWRGVTQRFVDGLRKAASLSEPVEFH